MGLNGIIDPDAEKNLGLNVDMKDRRMSICKLCPLFKYTTAGPICNSKLWLDPITREISDTKRPGFKNGCGCLLNNKTKQSFASCPLNKW